MTQATLDEFEKKKATQITTKKIGGMIYLVLFANLPTASIS